MNCKKERNTILKVKVTNDTFRTLKKQSRKKKKEKKGEITTTITEHPSRPLSGNEQQAINDIVHTPGVFFKPRPVKEFTCDGSSLLKWQVMGFEDDIHYYNYLAVNSLHNPKDLPVDICLDILGE